MAIILSFLKTFMWEILGVIIVGLVSFSAYRAVHSWCNKECITARKETDKIKYELVLANRKIEDAQKRATALALLWSQEVMKVEKTYKYEYEQTIEAYRKLKKRADDVALNSNPNCVISPDANRLLNDASRTANASKDPPASRSSEEGATTIPATPEGGKDSGVIVSEKDIVLSWIEASKAYSSVYIGWKACVEAYESLDGARQPPNE